MEEGRGCSACTKAYKASRSVRTAPKAWVIKKVSQGHADNAQCENSKPPTFWETAGKSACGRPPPKKSVKVTPARTHIPKKRPKGKPRGSESYGET